MPKKLLIFIVLFTIFSFVLRLYRFTEPGHYYFDEVYHAVTAKAYADNNPQAFNPYAPPPKPGTAYDWLHPPLAKLIQAASIKLFGDNPVGWRLPSIIVGTAIIPATFFLAYVLFGEEIAIFASLVVGFENLTFVMSRITMNDVFITFFSVVAVGLACLYLKSSKFKYLIASSIFLGMAVASKWSGLYAIGIVFLLVAAKDLIRKKPDYRKICVIVIPLFMYIGSYGQFFLQGHSFIYPSDIGVFFHNVFAKDLNKQNYIGDFAKLHQQIWHYQNTRDLKHPYATTAIYCVPEGLDGPKTWCPWILDIRGVYFSYEQYGSRAGFIYAIGNPLIFWVGIIAMSYMISDFFEKKKFETATIILGYLIFWVPWIFSPRVMFLYHYVPAIPFLAVSLGYVLGHIYKTKLRFLSYVLIGIFIAVFFYLYPISSGFPINPNNIGHYIWLSTWR